MPVTTDAEDIIKKAKINRFHSGLLIWGILLMIFDGFDLTVYGTIVPSITEEWELTSVQAGKYQSYALLGMMIGALIFGTLADRWGRKRVILFCIFLFSLFMILAGVSPTPEMFGLFRFITGLGLGGMMPNVIGLVSEYSPKGTISRTIATVMIGFSIGGVVASTLSIFLIPTFGWRSVFFFGAIPLLFVPFLIKTLPESMGNMINKDHYKEIQKTLMKIDKTYIPSDNEHFVLYKSKEATSTVGSLFINKQGFLTIMIWIIYFMSLLMVYGLNTWLPEFMANSGFPLGSSLSFLLALNTGATLGAILMGWVADRWGVGRSLILFFLIASISITSLGFTNNMFLLYIIAAIAGATTVGTQNLAHSYNAQFYSITTQSTALGWALGIGRIGGILGPTLGGILLASNFTLQMNFLAFAIPGIIALLVVFLANQYYKKVINN